MSFRDAVQRGRVQQPTQRAFNQEKWSAAFSEYGEGSADERLHASGLWFFTQLEDVRGELGPYARTMEMGYESARSIVGALNYQHAVVGVAASKHFKEVAESDDGGWLNPTVDLELPIGSGGAPVPAAGAIESTTDAARLPLATALAAQQRQASEPGMCHGPGTMRDLMTILELAGCYTVLEDLWLECLWLGRYVDESRSEVDVVTFEASVADEALRWAAGESRRGALQQEIAYRTGQTIRQRPEVFQSVWDARRTIHLQPDGRLRDEAGPREVAVGNLPAGLLAGLAAEELYWDKLLVEPLPSLDGVTIRELMRCWDIVSWLGEAVRRSMPVPTDGDVTDLTPYAPRIRVEEILGLLASYAGLQPTTARRVIDLLTLPCSPRADPWLTPLVPVGDEEVTLITAVALSANQIRLIEWWMREGGLDLGRRGELLEEHVRSRMQDAIVDTEFGIPHAVAPTAVVATNAAGETEEIDFVWRLGRVVVVGEVKCSVDPSEPLGRGDHLSTLRDAASQASRKAAFLRDAPETWGQLRVGQFADDEPEFVSAVVTNLPQRVGHPIGEVAVVDYYVLSKFMVGKVGLLSRITDDGEVESLHEKPLYTDDLSAQAALPGYLLSPRHLRLHQLLVKPSIYSIPRLSEDKKPRVAVGFRVNVT